MVGTQAVEIPKDFRRRGQCSRRQGGHQPAQAAAEQEKQSAEEDDAGSRQQDSARAFQRQGWRQVRRGFKDAGSGHQAPDDEMAPVHFPAVGGVVRRGGPHPPCAACAQFPGVGEPVVGIRFDEKPLGAPSPGSIRRGGHGLHMPCKAADAGIREPGEPSQPGGQRGQAGDAGQPTSPVGKFHGMASGSRRKTWAQVFCLTRPRGVWKT